MQYQYFLLEPLGKKDYEVIYAVKCLENHIVDRLASAPWTCISDDKHITIQWLKNTNKWHIEEISKEQYTCLQNIWPPSNILSVRPNK